MEKNKLKDELIGSISHFLLNYPVKKIKKYLWDLYREWVHTSEFANPKEHSEMLLFYECLSDLIIELNDTCEKLSKK